MRQLTVTVACLGLIYALVACAHQQNQTAKPDSPKVAQSQPAPQPETAPAPSPAPKAEAPAPNQPRQYQGRPPQAAKPKPEPTPMLVLTGLPGWRVVNVQPFSLIIQHVQTEGIIIFKVMPTLQVGPPDGLCHALRQAGIQKQLKPGKLRIAKSKLSCSFPWRQHLKEKDAKIRHWRGKVSVDLRPELPAATVLMIGQWPAKHHKLMSRHFDAYRQSCKVILRQPDRAKPQKNIDRLK